MRRYPKRARPLWGCAKPKKPVEYIYEPLSVVVSGVDRTGAPTREVVEWPDGAATVTCKTVFDDVRGVTFVQSKMRADLRIKVSIGRAEDRATPTSGVYMLSDVARDISLRADEVLTLPPVEVRL